jgi:hypothetical protein
MTESVCASEQLKCSKVFNFILAFYQLSFIMQLNSFIKELNGEWFDQCRNGN